MFLSSWKSLEGKCLGGNYVLQTLLGTGGFGAVFLVKCLDDQAITDKVLADLAQHTGEPVSVFKIESSASQNWTDSCLGLAQKGQICAQVITSGWKITVQSEQKNLSLPHQPKWPHDFIGTLTPSRQYKCGKTELSLEMYGHLKC